MKEETNVAGFIAVSNVSSHPLSISLDVSDRAGGLIVNHGLTVSSHATKIVQLPELLSANTPDGGIRATFAGRMSDVLIEGGLEDAVTGYSADLTFLPALSDASAVSSNQYALLGLMTGAADPMLKFPAGTVFTPYANVRNVSKQNVLLTPVLWWMEGAAARSARLPQVTVLPLHSASLDVPAMLSAAGLQKFKGSINLVLDVAGPSRSLLVAAGSVDQKNTYVFSVPPSATRESVAKVLSYWSTANGDDTMVTLWNPADDAQDFVFTLFFAGGEYELPVHLEGRVSRAFNISEIVGNQIPDAGGRTVPIGVHEGSAEVAGSKGGNQHIMVAMAAGTYNVVKATCQWYCITCQGGKGGVSSGNIATGTSAQLALTVYNHDGSEFDDTGNASWSSSNESVATVAGGLVNGVTAGTSTITASDSEVLLYDKNLCAYGDLPDCGSEVGVSASAVTTVYDATPVITAINPSSFDMLTQTTVQISGRNFGTNQPQVSVSIPGSTVQVTSYSDTQITVVINAGDSGAGTIQVTSTGFNGQGFEGAPNGGGASASGAFTSTAPPYASAVDNDMTFTPACSSGTAKLRTIQYCFVDKKLRRTTSSAGIMIKETFSAMNPTNGTSTCDGSKPIMALTCTGPVTTYFVDGLGTGCGVAGCGISRTNQQWVQCPSTTLGTVGNLGVYNNGITVGGNSTMWPAGTVFLPGGGRATATK